MKFAFAATDDHLFARIDEDLARAKFIIIVNPEYPESYECILNPFHSGMTQNRREIADLIRNREVNAVITRGCDTDIIEYLKKDGIRVYRNFSGTIMVNLKKLRKTPRFETHGTGKSHLLHISNSDREVKH